MSRNLTIASNDAGGSDTRHRVLSGAFFIFDRKKSNLTSGTGTCIWDPVLFTPRIPGDFFRIPDPKREQKLNVEYKNVKILLFIPFGTIENDEKLNFV
jgi:hypothetical protein